MQLSNLLKDASIEGAFIKAQPNLVFNQIPFTVPEKSFNSSLQYALLLKYVNTEEEGDYFLNQIINNIDNKHFIGTTSCILFNMSEEGNLTKGIDKILKVYFSEHSFPEFKPLLNKILDISSEYLL